MMDTGPLASANQDNATTSPLAKGLAGVVVTGAVEGLP